MSKTINLNKMSAEELQQQKGNCLTVVELSSTLIEQLSQTKREADSIVTEINRVLIKDTFKVWWTD